MKLRSSTQLDQAPKPRDSLEALEKAAIRHRRILRALRTGFGDSDWSRSLDDAVSEAATIEQLARYGLRCPAAEAKDLADRLEPLVHRLADRTFELLASMVSV